MFDRCPSITFNWSYSFKDNLPLSARDGCTVLGSKAVLIAYLVSHNDVFKLRAVTSLFIYDGALYSLTRHALIPKDQLRYLRSPVVYLDMGGKLVQAHGDYKTKHTG